MSSLNDTGSSFSFSFFGDLGASVEDYYPSVPSEPASLPADAIPSESSAEAERGSARASCRTPQEKTPLSHRVDADARDLVYDRSSPLHQRKVTSKRSRSSTPLLSRPASPAESSPAHESRDRVKRTLSPDKDAKHEFNLLPSDAALPPAALRPQPFFLSRPDPSTRYASASSFSTSQNLLQYPQRQRAPLAPRAFATLSNDELFPSLKGLTMAQYGPFLSDDPIELVRSSKYWHAIMQFLQSITSTDKWRSNPNSSYNPRDAFPIMAALQSQQPKKSAIVRVVGKLGSSTRFKGLPEHLHLRIRALRDVMRWVWDTHDIALENTAWLIAEASINRALLPVYILLREHYSTLRFSDAVEVAQRELLSYLTNAPSSSLSPREQRALVLIQWLNKDRMRWFSFFATSDRRLRAEEPAEGWLSEPKEGEVRGEAALDEWERGMLRKEAWRAR